MSRGGVQNNVTKGLPVICKSTTKHLGMRLPGLRKCQVQPHPWASQHPRRLKERVSRAQANLAMDIPVVGIGT